jgi:hypothetical protein
MTEFFAGLAIVFALLLFGKRGGSGPGALPPGTVGPGAFPPNNPTYNNPPNLPSGPTNTGCGCAGANSYTPPGTSQTIYGNIRPASPNPSAPASSGAGMTYVYGNRITSNQYPIIP